MLRKAAREVLGNRPFKSGWLWPLLICLIASTITQITSSIAIIATSLLATATATYFLSIIRGTGKANDIGGYFKFFAKANIKSHIILSLIYSLYKFLWGMIPVVGIIKSLSYSMTFYIKRDHPEYTANEAITKSREIMNGNKWRFFCLQLSFIGWDLLSIIAAPIAYWVLPYKETAYALFYEEIKGEATEVELTEEVTEEDKEATDNIEVVTDNIEAKIEALASEEPKKEEPLMEEPKKSGKPTAQAFGSLEHLTEEQIAKRKKIAAVWDKITTGLLIALMASPVAIIGWIFFYFIAITQGWFGL
jgi:hypothetical protein